MIKALVSFLLAIPELIKLIESMQKMASQHNKKIKIKDDIKKINKAFEDGDAKALNDLFNS